LTKENGKVFLTCLPTGKKTDISAMKKIGLALCNNEVFEAKELEIMFGLRKREEKAKSNSTSRKNYHWWMADENYETSEDGDMQQIIDMKKREEKKSTPIEATIEVVETKKEEIQNTPIEEEIQIVSKKEKSTSLKSKVMKKAWKLYKELKETMKNTFETMKKLFSHCLKLAWADCRA
jgi:hypothetical protein